MGYVGLPLSLTLIKKKINVIGFDVNKSLIANLKKNVTQI
jgi:UDP-N-acetyl-D-mannosaminuronate dehydrogenase